MKFIITGRKIDLTDGIRSSVESKLSKLDKLLVKDAEAFVTISVEKDRQTVEVTIHAGDMMLRAEETSKDLYASLDTITDVLERQVRKHKTRLEKRWRKGGYEFQPEDIDEVAEEEPEFKIVKTKRFDVKPMSAEEAILQMNLLGHTFFIFTDMKTERPQIVYKRKDGDYGLIEIN